MWRPFTRRVAILVATATVLGIGWRGGIAVSAANQPRTVEQNVMNGYVNANGLNMYYEVHGEGEPLVLLHGAFMTIDLNFGKMLPVLATGRRIVAVELQGHGHTEDLDRPLSFEQMADDTAALLGALSISRADVFGYSMGGTTAVELAIRHPDLVRKLIVMSAPYDRAGWYPEVYTTLESITPEAFVGSGLPEAHAAARPNHDWPTLVAKVKALDVGFVGRTAEEFQSIRAPILIIVGDSDGVPLDKAVEMFRLLGGGVVGDIAGLPRSQLAIIPGSTHVGVMEQTHLLLPMITAFLEKSE
jgi:pimeloyl-ACP methyl ester carboxylesterase